MSYSFSRLSGFENIPIHFESVEELHLELYYEENDIFEPKPADVLTFSRLKMFTLSFWSEHSTPFFGFVTANSYIEKLVLKISYNMNPLFTLCLFFFSFIQFHVNSQF